MQVLPEAKAREFRDERRHRCVELASRGSARGEGPEDGRVGPWVCLQGRNGIGWRRNSRPRDAMGAARALNQIARHYQGLSQLVQHGRKSSNESFRVFSMVFGDHIAVKPIVF